MKEIYEHTDSLLAMRLALYEITDQIGNIVQVGEVEESLLGEYNRTRAAILDDASELGDREWVTDRLTQSVYDLQTLQRIARS